MKTIYTILFFALSVGIAFGQTKIEENIEGEAGLLARVVDISKLGVSEEDYFIRASDWPVAITINRGKRLISIVVVLDDTKRPGFEGFDYSYRTEKPVTDLPRKIMIPDDKRDKIIAWMKKNGFKHEIAFYQSKQGGVIEAYYSFFAAYLKGDDSDLNASQIIKFFSSEVFESESTTFSFTTIKRG
jgi:hypothetical protein